MRVRVHVVGDIADWQTPGAGSATGDLQTAAENVAWAEPADAVASSDGNMQDLVLIGMSSWCCRWPHHSLDAKQEFCAGILCQCSSFACFMRRTPLQPAINVISQRVVECCCAGLTDDAGSLEACPPNGAGMSSTPSAAESPTDPEDVDPALWEPHVRPPMNILILVIHRASGMTWNCPS